MARHWLTALLFSPALLSGACLTPASGQRGYPLYPGAEAPLAPDRVAQLNLAMPSGSSGSASFLRTIDGRDVSSLGSAFELLPGCHVVMTESRLVITNEAVTFTGQIGSRVIPFRMKAGHEYTVVVELAEHLGNTAGVTVYGREHAPSGQQTENIPAATSMDDIRACLSWTPAAN